MYQALKAYFVDDYGMIFVLRLIALIAIAPQVLADSNSNAVNERLPVRKAEVEAHWKVDCQVSWAGLLELRSKGGGQACDLPSNLRRELQLCAFIYQPPGVQSLHTDPDYQGAINSMGGGGQCQKASNTDSKK